MEIPKKTNSQSEIMASVDKNLWNIGVDLCSSAVYSHGLDCYQVWLWNGFPLVPDSSASDIINEL